MYAFVPPTACCRFASRTTRGYTRNHGKYLWQTRAIAKSIILISIGRSVGNSIKITTTRYDFVLNQKRSVAAADTYFMIVLVFAVLRAAVSSASHLLAGALVTTIVALVFRDDLVARAIAACAAKTPPDDGDDDEDDDDDTAWKDAAASLKSARVPATVALQVLVNRLRQFRTDRLAPVDKRLETAGKTLLATVRMERRARTIVRSAV